MKRMLVLALCLISVSASAQDTARVRTDAITPKDARKPAPSESFTRCLIAPETVMEHQAEIGLDAVQRTRIIDEMAAAQAQFTKLQWELTAVQQQVTRELRRPNVDESVLKQFDAMLQLENQLKRAQLTVLIRVKNVLTPQQQAQVRTLAGGDAVYRVSGELVPVRGVCTQ
ncbi:MAG TPA: hypothetical protein VJR92_12940 [Gemmatimonadaceae bacterium]|nr:hypothetical protein [Gemmatimonadaceae bacterium]